MATSTSTRPQRRSSRAPQTPTNQSFVDVDSPDYNGPVTRSVARRRTTAASAAASFSSAIAEQDQLASPSKASTTRRGRRPQQPVKKAPSSSSSASATSIDDDNSDRLHLESDHDGVDTVSSSGSPQRTKVPILSAPPASRLSAAAAAAAATSATTDSQVAPPKMRHPKKEDSGLLVPPASSTWVWDLSRSPSPLGLIPIHSKWHSFIHKHEVPRKLLHVSIGFFSLWLYVSGTQPTAVTPWLMGALIPITIVDVLRHNVPVFNKFYVRYLGALMRESEYAGYNGVIFYLLGAWTALHFFPKDVGLMGVMLLSWCDTAASTFGRLYGRYTPKVRRGKSLAGSLAAMLTGILTAVYFWGYLAPRIGFVPGDEQFPFMFTGQLQLPEPMAEALGLTATQATLTGKAALGVMSFFTGFIASASEVVDLFGWDDNLTIPVLSGLGIWGFLKIFG